MRFSKVCRKVLTIGQITSGLNPWRGFSVLVLLIIVLIGNARAHAQFQGEARHRTASIIYVSNAARGITEVNSLNNSVIATAPFGGNATGIAVTPDGRDLYIADGDEGQVSVIDTSTNVPVANIPVGIGGEHRSVAITSDSAFAYVTSQVSNTLTIVATATNTVVKSISMSGEPIWVTFSPDGSRAYVSNQTGGTLSVVSTSAQDVIAAVPGFSAPFHSAFTKDGRYLLVSSQGDNSIKVVNPHTNTIVKSIPTGPIPRKIAFSADGTRAYVTNFGGNAVDVLDVWRQTNLGTPIIVGNAPWGIATTPDGVGYVANYNDNTISVLDTSTNTVTATLNARANPQDVTLTTRARPAILNYKFKSIDAPGAIDTRPGGINFQGAIVGAFTDANNQQHGFLRSPTGLYTTIDVPGATLTQAVDINAFGVAVGIYRDANGNFRGFRREANGNITLIDFPGAVETGAYGINAQGDVAGTFDTGDPSTGIGYVLRHGLFTTIEHPDAAPMQTTVFDINEAGLITGAFNDAGGSEHGFLLRGSNFSTVDFPGANFTEPWRTNIGGTTVGQYVTNFLHGFVLNDHSFLSFDFPDSRNTVLRGVDEAGRIVGYSPPFGSTNAHAFLATLTEDR
jgi:YVTN family beta-propeller protein